MAETVSLRAAAEAIGIARSTLSRLLAAEPSLAACVAGRSRGSLAIDLPKLRAAWQQLAGTGTDNQISDRERLEAARRRRAWFDLQGWLAELDQLEGSLIDAAEHRAVHDRALAALRAAAAGWVETVAEGLPAVAPEDAPTWVERTVHDALMAVIGAYQREPEPPPPPRSIAFPADPPTLLAIKAETEGTRARIAELRLQLQRGEVLNTCRVSDEISSQALQFRDGWRRVGQQLALRRRSLTTSESVRTAALQELSRVGLA